MLKKLMKRYQQNWLYLHEFFFKQKTFLLENTVVISGSPRSGTTWLGNILNKHIDYCMLTEPFNLRDPALQDAGYTWRTYVPHEYQWPNGYNIAYKIFTGQHIYKSQLLDNNLINILRAKSLLIKSVRLNRLFPWLTNNFNLRGQIYLIRHPCAVIASQKIHQAFPKQVLNDFDLAFIEEHLSHLHKPVQKLKTEEELRAIMWSIDQLVPLSISNPPWLTVSYEQLVANGDTELKRISDYLNLELTSDMIEQLEQPSREAQRWSADPKQSIEKRLSGWQQRLDEETIDRILDVVDMFGIQGFSKDIFPDTTAFQNIVR